MKVIAARNANRQATVFGNAVECAVSIGDQLNLWEHDVPRLRAVLEQAEALLNSLHVGDHMTLRFVTVRLSLDLTVER